MMKMSDDAKKKEIELNRKGNKYFENSEGTSKKDRDILELAKQKLGK